MKGLCSPLRGGALIAAPLGEVFVGLVDDTASETYVSSPTRMYVDRIIALYRARGPSHTQWDPWLAPRFTHIPHKGRDMTGY